MIYICFHRSLTKSDSWCILRYSENYVSTKMISKVQNVCPLQSDNVPLHNSMHEQIEFFLLSKKYSILLGFFVFRIYVNILLSNCCFQFNFTDIQRIKNYPKILIFRFRVDFRKKRTNWFIRIIWINTRNLKFLELLIHNIDKWSILDDVCFKLYLPVLM